MRRALALLALAALAGGCLGLDAKMDVQVALENELAEPVVLQVIVGGNRFENATLGPAGSDEARAALGSLTFYARHVSVVVRDQTRGFAQEQTVVVADGDTIRVRVRAEDIAVLVESSG